MSETKTTAMEVKVSGEWRPAIWISEYGSDDIRLVSYRGDDGEFWAVRIRRSREPEFLRPAPVRIRVNGGEVGIGGLVMGFGCTYRIKSVREDGKLFVDAWHNGKWVELELASRSSLFRLPTPSDIPADLPLSDILAADLRAAVEKLREPKFPTTVDELRAFVREAVSNNG